MKTVQEIYELLEVRRNELGLSQAEVGRLAFDQADGSALQNMKRGSAPGFDRLSALADVLGLEFYLGQPRTYSKGFADPVSETDLSRVEALRGGYLPIPWHLESRRPGSSPVAFSKEWMEAHALIPDNLLAIVPDAVHLPNASFRETVVVVDTSPHRLRQNGLCAFKRAGVVQIAYVTFARELVIVAGAELSKGSAVIFPDDEAPLRPLGQVVWSGHVWR